MTNHADVNQTFTRLNSLLGKNRPLDEDEMEFMNKLADNELSKRRKLQEAEEEELTAFQEVCSCYLVLHSLW